MGRQYISEKGNHGTFHKDLIDYSDDKILECVKAGNNNSAYFTYKEKEDIILLFMNTIKLKISNGLKIRINGRN